MKVIKTLYIAVIIILATTVLGACSSNGNKNRPGDSLVSMTVHEDSKTVYYIGDEFDFNDIYVDIKINAQFGGALTLEKYNLGENSYGFEIREPKGFSTIEEAENLQVTLHVLGSAKSNFHGNIIATFKVTVMSGEIEFE